MSSKSRRSTVALKELQTFRVAASVTERAVFDFFKALDTPLSLGLWLRYVNGEYQQLVDKEIRPEDYISPSAFRADYTAINFLSKANFLDLEVSKREQAIRKFQKFETQCGLTNRRLGLFCFDPHNSASNDRLLLATRRKIQMILGDFSPEELVDNANWGPGVSTLLKGDHVSGTNKFHSENGITHELYSLVMPWFATAYPLWADHLESQYGPQLFELQRGNSIVTVPKNSKTDRVIAIEPGINLWFQKAVGTMIRRRLARFGIDLNSQERNQDLARQSSIDDSLATIDFSSASDSISIACVEELLPPRWFDLLSRLRCRFGDLDGETLVWKKFSSMGNGFTFELESLIFFAAAWASCEVCGVSKESVSVFGDDVILPSKGPAETFSSFSAFLGFQVNNQKSFFCGCFRESCGSHFYDGLCCKPIFLKERLQNVQAIYRLANNVRRLAHRHNSHRGCDARFLHTVRHLRSGVPNLVRFVIPEGVGDGGFIGNFDEATPTVSPNGYEGYLTPMVLEVGVTQHFEGVGLLLARLWDQRPINLWGVLQRKGAGNTYTLRGRTKTRISDVLVPSWYDLGAWC